MIDYGPLERNPRLLIRQIRDALVEIVPGANLGKMPVNIPGRSRPFPALYFALKSEIWERHPAAASTAAPRASLDPGASAHKRAADDRQLTYTTVKQEPTRR